jgi:hypothetical protein
MPWGLQFGWPKVKGVSQYLDELFTEVGYITPVMVMLGVYSNMVPWLLIDMREEKALGIVGPYLTINEALFKALQLGEPYILILHKNIPQLEMANLVSKIFFERKKRGVLPVPAECIDWVKEHEHYISTDSIVEEKITIFARMD